MATIRAVPRTYRGVRFASTLEADWAATLDALAIAWQYEPDAVTLPSGELYRPDFYLPECTTWLEVKGPHDERIGKTHAMAAAVAHKATCTGFTGDEIIIHALERDEPVLAAALATAPDGPTQVTIIIRRVNTVTPTLDLLRTHRARRRVHLDLATIETINDAMRMRSVDCSCGHDETAPWRLVVIGRPATRGAMSWESATLHRDVTLIRCTDCGKHSFFDETYSWVCRRCDAGGKVYQGGQFWSADQGYVGGDTMAFVRAPRSAA